MSTAQAKHSTLQPFHLAFPVTDIEVARKFYGEVIGCEEGRSAPHWVDFNFYGHQRVAHLAPEEVGCKANSSVDGHAVPAKHFGVILTMDQWTELADRLKAAGTKFVIEPYIRFKGQVGEQATMFFMDPCGNALEFKAFANMDQIFAK